MGDELPEMPRDAVIRSVSRAAERKQGDEARTEVGLVLRISENPSG